MNDLDERFYRKVPEVIPEQIQKIVPKINQSKEITTVLQAIDIIKYLRKENKELKKEIERLTKNK